VFSSRRWQRVALALNVIGAGILFFSFQATSSDFRLVTVNEKSVLSPEPIARYALCVNNFTVLETNSKGSLTIGHVGCPDWEHSRPAAVVNFEHPSFVTLGLIMLVLGFFLQFLAVPGPKTIAQMRSDIKAAKLADKKETRI
jgi:hypothetical protein